LWKQHVLSIVSLTCHQTHDAQYMLFPQHKHHHSTLGFDPIRLKAL